MRARFLPFVARAAYAESNEFPAGDLCAFLMMTRAGRTPALLARKRALDVHTLARMLEEAPQSAEPVRVTAAAAIALDEQPRLRLLRHIR